MGCVCVSPAFWTCSSLLACSRMDRMASSEPPSGPLIRVVMFPTEREREREAVRERERERERQREGEGERERGREGVGEGGRERGSLNVSIWEQSSSRGMLERLAFSGCLE